MTNAEIRLKLIELTRPAASNPDVAIWIAKAAALETWVMSSNYGGAIAIVDAITPSETPAATEGQAETPPQKRGSGKSRLKSGEPEFGPAF